MDDDREGRIARRRFRSEPHAKCRGALSHWTLAEGVLDADLLRCADAADQDVHRLLTDAAPALLAQEEWPGNERHGDEEERATRDGACGEESRERVALSAAEGPRDEERARESGAGGRGKEKKLRQDSPR